MTDDVPSIVRSSAWPVWEVGVYGFGDIYVEAPTKASARWWTVSRMHEAGYGQSRIELIRRGVDVRAVSRTTASISGDIHRVKHCARKASARDALLSHEPERKS